MKTYLMISTFVISALSSGAALAASPQLEAYGLNRVTGNFSPVSISAPRQGCLDRQKEQIELAQKKIGKEIDFHISLMDLTQVKSRPYARIDEESSSNPSEIHLQITRSGDICGIVTAESIVEKIAAIEQKSRGQASSETLDSLLVRIGRIADNLQAIDHHDASIAAKMRSDRGAKPVTDGGESRSPAQSGTSTSGQ